MADSANSTLLPSVREMRIDGALVETINARDLHAWLEVGKDFSTWIKDRITAYEFKENSDFVVFPEFGENPSGGRPAKEYALTLDMAKELSMVERNDRGKQARQYFIACERRAKSASLVFDEKAKAAIAEIAAAVFQAGVATIVPALVKAEMAKGYTPRYGRTAGHLWRDFGFPPLKGVSVWFGARLARAGCAVEDNARGELGVSTARLFDPDKARIWISNGGRFLVEQKIAERKGQGKLRLVGSAGA